jgi:hypothetical protein
MNCRNFTVTPARTDKAKQLRRPPEEIDNQKIIRLLLSLVVFGYRPAAVAISDLPTYEVSDSTPIIFSEKLNIRVLEDPSAMKTINEVMQSPSEFVLPEKIQNIRSGSRYWVAQRIRSSLSEPLVLRIDPSGWESTHSHLVRVDGGIETLKVSGALYAKHNHHADMNPFVLGSRQTGNQFSRFTLHIGEEVLVMSQLRPNANLQARNISLAFCDDLKFSKTCRLGLYIEGTLLGILFALGIFGWFSAANTKNGASYAYSVWILVAFCQILSNAMPEGARLSEFLIDVEGLEFGNQSAYWPSFVIFGYLLCHVCRLFSQCSRASSSFAKSSLSVCVGLCRKLLIHVVCTA